jgi:hypothetical protein
MEAVQKHHPIPAPIQAIMFPIDFLEYRWIEIFISPFVIDDHDDDDNVGWM